jgi:phytanoyl-CoA hydroxylase
MLEQNLLPKTNLISPLFKNAFNSQKKKKMSYLSAEQIDFFQVNGYLVIVRFWDEETVVKLRDAINLQIENLDLTDPSAGSTFTTNDQTRKSDTYFLESGPKISFFWEERAWDDDGS